MEAFQVKYAKALCIYKNETVLTDTDGNEESPLASCCNLNTAAVQHFTHTMPCTNKLTADMCILEKAKRGNGHANI